MNPSKILNISGKTLLTIVGYFFTFIVAAMLTQGGSDGAGEEAQSPDSQTVLMLLLIGLVNGLVFSWYLYRTQMRAWRLSGILFLLVFGVHTLLPQMESWLFQAAVGMNAPQLASIVWMGAISALLFASIAPFIWRKPETIKGKLSALPTHWKVWIVLPLLYLILYFLFGYFLAWHSAAVREYYQGHTEMLPFFAHLQNVAQEDPNLILFQWFRGFIWTGLAMLLMMSIKASRWEKMLLVGFFFAAPAVILLLPNPFMPETVRWVHLLETASSNFVFGGLAVWLAGAVQATATTGGRKDQ